jgi:hypothetical protein
MFTATAASSLADSARPTSKSSSSGGRGLSFACAPQGAQASNQGPGCRPRPGAQSRRSASHNRQNVNYHTQSARASFRLRARGFLSFGFLGGWRYAPSILLVCRQWLRWRAASVDGGRSTSCSAVAVARVSPGQPSAFVIEAFGQEQSPAPATADAAKDSSPHTSHLTPRPLKAILRLPSPPLDARSRGH